MITPSAMYLSLAWRYVILFVCACFATTVMMTDVTQAQSNEPHTKKSVAGDRSQIDQGALLIHGNYCGLGSRPGAPPVDALDAACMRHDACMPSKGLPSCGCMVTLQHEAEAVAHNSAEPLDIQILASATAAGAALTLCETSRSRYGQ